jgi:hypothetical protein
MARQATEVKTGFSKQQMASLAQLIQQAVATANVPVAQAKGKKQRAKESDVETGNARITREVKRKNAVLADAGANYRWSFDGTHGKLVTLRRCDAKGNPKRERSTVFSWTDGGKLVKNRLFACTTDGDIVRV